MPTQPRTTPVPTTMVTIPRKSPTLRTHPVPATPVPTTMVTISPTGTATPGIRACTADSDCVPEQCCHPTGCINRQYKGVCTLLCTNICEGPVDCGAGHCGCVNGTCGVIPGS